MPTGSLVTCGGTVRIATVSYPSNGIQNGAPDAIALVNGSGQLVQFMSYEGTVTGSSGPAAGRTSTNLPVSETGSTPAGTSLQLGGSGSTYANFSWKASATQTFGACNNGQSFAAANPAPKPAVEPHAELRDQQRTLLAGIVRRDGEWVLGMDGRIAGQSESAAQVLALIMQAGELHERKGTPVRLVYSDALRDAAQAEANAQGLSFDEFKDALAAKMAAGKAN